MLDVFLNPAFRPIWQRSGRKAGCRTVFRKALTTIVDPYAQVATMRRCHRKDGAGAGMTRHWARLADVDLDIVFAAECGVGPTSGDRFAHIRWGFQGQRKLHCVGGVGSRFETM